MSAGLATAQIQASSLLLRRRSARGCSHPRPVDTRMTAPIRQFEPHRDTDPELRCYSVRADEAFTTHYSITLRQANVTVASVVDWYYGQSSYTRTD